jgi:hypothetical protein
MALAAAPAAAPPLLPVPYYAQLQGNWCWAACSQMVFGYYHTNSLQQCDLASRQFNQLCCVNPSSAACDCGEWPENVYPKYNMGYSIINAAMSFTDVANEIAQHRPVEVYYAWTGGGAHVALITGVYDNNDVWVDDPYYGAGRRAFNAVQNGYGLGQWTISYSDIAPLAATATAATATATATAGVT